MANFGLGGDFKHKSTQTSLGPKSINTTTHPPKLVLGSKCVKTSTSPTKLVWARNLSKQVQIHTNQFGPAIYQNNHKSTQTSLSPKWIKTTTNPHKLVWARNRSNQTQLHPNQFGPEIAKYDSFNTDNKVIRTFPKVAVSVKKTKLTPNLLSIIRAPLMENQGPPRNPEIFPWRTD